MVPDSTIMTNSFSRAGVTRRHFLAAAGLALAAPTLIPASALGREDRPAPSGRVTLGVVGWGMQGPSNTDAFLHLKDCQVVATCDLDKNHLQSALDKVNGHYGNKDCASFHDYRELMARKDIDAVMLAVPDTWHALVATEAARNKKDIYGEKPLARTISEQQAIVKAVRDNGRIWQTGSWQRSQGPFRRAAEIVRNGLIGKVTRVEVGLPSGAYALRRTGSKMSVTDPPPNLDYNFWLGPSRIACIEGRVHMNWRWNYNVAGDCWWIGHHCDIAHWGLGMDDQGGPSEIKGHGEFPAKDAVWNTCASLGSISSTRTTLRWSSPGDTATFEAARNGSARMAGCGLTAAVLTRQTSIGEDKSRRTSIRVKLLQIRQPSRKLYRVREVAQAHNHARRDRPSLGNPRPFRADLDAGRAQDQMGS